jgi:hypothetical protein
MVFGSTVIHQSPHHPSLIQSLNVLYYRKETSQETSFKNSVYVSVNGNEYTRNGTRETRHLEKSALT